MMLAAIGGLSLKHWYSAPEFYWRANRALRQAQHDQQCMHAEVFRQDALYFSLSVWRDAEAMRAYAQSGPHLRVMLAANRLAQVNRFFHFECSEIPSAELALRYWWQHIRAAE